MARIEESARWEPSWKNIPCEDGSAGRVRDATSHKNGEVSRNDNETAWTRDAAGCTDGDDGRRPQQQQTTNNKQYDVFRAGHHTRSCTHDCRVLVGNDDVGNDEANSDI